MRLRTKVDGIAEYGADSHHRRSTGGEQITAEKMLVSIGRRPNSQDIGLETVGVEIDGRGYIVVNEKLETTAPGVYAIGDVNGGILLAHVASYEGLVAAENCRAAPGAGTRSGAQLRLHPARDGEHRPDRGPGQGARASSR